MYKIPFCLCILQLQIHFFTNTCYKDDFLNRMHSRHSDGWRDGTSRNNVSPFKFFTIPGRLRVPETQCPSIDTSLSYCINIYISLLGGGTGRPETMCPRTNVLRPLVPKWIVPCDTLSLDWNIPVIMHYEIRFGWWNMEEMYQCRDFLFLRRFI